MSISDLLFGYELREGKTEEFPRFLKSRFPFGKFLALTDEESAAALGNALKSLPKKIMLVLQPTDDLLPLFNLSDGVTCVVGAGAACAAARYFAAVRSLPFVALCLSCASEELAREKVSVVGAGAVAEYPVPLPSVLFADFFSMEKNTEGVKKCAAFLSACALSLFSRRAARALALPDADCGEDTQNLLSAAVGVAFAENTPKALFRAALTAGYCFRSGFPEGEIFRLAELAQKREKDGQKGETLFSCVSALSKLYALFFESGFYRGGKVDYNARRAAAEKLCEGTAVLRNIDVPDVETLEGYAEKFSAHCGELFSEISALNGELIRFAAAAGLDAERTDGKEKAAAELALFLPELSEGGYGILSLMRDFALL